MPSVRLSSISRSIGARAILWGIDLEVRDGEIVSLLGPSGCGKSSLLRIVAGLDAPDSGMVEIDGRVCTDVPASRRNIAMVFQNLALYPQMTARQNLALPLRVRRMTRMQRLTSPLRKIAPRFLMGDARRQEQKIARDVETLAGKLGISDLLDRLPAKMSGGQRQRVAIGRALIRDCRLLLLDEPLSSLDAKLREQARNEIVQILRGFGVACIFVTHDQSEAFAISDRVAVMLDGRIAHYATPSEIYHAPANLAVAQFVGSPTINRLAVDSAAGRFGLEGLTLGADVVVPIGSATMAFRPEHLQVRAAPVKGPRWTIARIEDHGHDGLLHVTNEHGHSLAARIVDPAAWRCGQTIAITIQRALFFDAQGDRLEAEPLPEALHG
ncbi:ABC transporter ATP-binding protein [Rhodopseudomonas sp. B29]|uniref:ABC transporter ATP-binding protein n=1 Tax=Rhodopseudomonas sp. B29 TaxID=95607 RepID=UPI00034B97D9|nr:ABC transporter ATP-binding protein [Rhodopseudomonas sp. B29]